MTFIVPDACTLPTVEQPLRVAEFDALFARAVRSVDRVDERHVRLILTGDPGVADEARDLTARESACCSFFGFTVTAHALDISVPPDHVDVLDSLAARAEALAS